MNFFNFFYVFPIFFEILKNERNVTNFGYVFVTRFQILEFVSLMEFPKR